MYQAFLHVAKEEDEARVTHMPYVKKNGFASSPVQSPVVPVSVRDLSNRPLACASCF